MKNPFFKQNQVSQQSGQSFLYNKYNNSLGTNKNQSNVLQNTNIQYNSFQYSQVLNTNLINFRQQQSTNNQNNVENLNCFTTQIFENQQIIQHSRSQQSDFNIQNSRINQKLFHNNQQNFYIAKKEFHKNINTLKRYNGGTFIKKKFIKILKSIGKTKYDIDQVSLQVKDNNEVQKLVDFEVEKYKQMKSEKSQLQIIEQQSNNNEFQVNKFNTCGTQSDTSINYKIQGKKIMIDKQTDTNDIPYVEIKDAHTSLFDRENFYNKLLETKAFVELSNYLDENKKNDKKFDKNKFLKDMAKQLCQMFQRKLKPKIIRKILKTQNILFLLLWNINQIKNLSPSNLSKIKMERIFNPKYGEEKISWTDYGRLRECKESKYFEGDICNEMLWQDVIQKQKQRNSTWMFTNVLMDPAWTLTALDLNYDEIENEKWMNAIPIKELQKVGYLWMWVTNSQLESALKYFEKHNYKRVDIVYWVKVKDDWSVDDLIGYYLRHSIEMCLVGQLQENKDLLKQLQTTNKAPQYIIEQRRQQSRKPDKIYSIIKTLMPYGDCLEIFGRCYNIHDEFWTVGNEAIQLKQRPEQKLKTNAYEYQININNKLFQKIITLFLIHILKLIIISFVFYQ